MEGTPNVIVALAQVAFVLAAFGTFLRFPPRSALLLVVAGGFLFLPVFAGTAYAAPLLRRKEMLIAGVALAASLMVDRHRWVRFRPRLLDLPAAVFCLAPIATSLTNGLGLYDGLQAAFQESFTWGVPYLLGRLYLGDLSGLRELARTVVAAALVYTPLCLWEVRMSPQLHYQVFGYRPYAGFVQSVRM